MSSVALHFRVFGTPVTVGPDIVIGLGVLGLLSRLWGIALAEWIALGFVALLLHELGHAMAFRRYGVKSSIRFFLLGGLTVPDDPDAASQLTHREMIVVPLAGPLVGLVLGGIMFGFWPVFQHAPSEVKTPMFIWAFVNLGWGIFNLMPIGSLDGGQILRNAAAAAIPGRGGVALGLASSLVASVVVALVAVAIHQVYVALIAVVFGLADTSVYGQLRDAIFPAGGAGPAAEPDERPAAMDDQAGSAGPPDGSEQMWRRPPPGP